jgi:hypothetical protein
MRQFVLGLGILFVVTGPAWAAEPSPNTASLQVRIDSIAADGSSIKITRLLQLTSESAGVSDKDIKEQLKRFVPGDIVAIQVEGKESALEVKKLSLLAHTAGIPDHLIAFIAAAALVLGCVAVFSDWAPLRFLMGVDRRYSNSQFQLAVWFGVFATVYIATLMLRVWEGGLDILGGVNIPPNLLMLSGLSALTFGAAKAITGQKVANAMAAGGGNPKPPLPAGTPPSLTRDLVQNDQGQVDLGDFQMLFITVVAAIVYLITAFHFLSTIEIVRTLTLPDVDTSLLAGFGLGQGAYLVKKMAGNPGQT